MTILLQRSHTTETIIGIEREKDSRERERELCELYTLMAAAAERAHENGIDRRHTFRVVADGGVAMGGGVGRKKGGGFAYDVLEEGPVVVCVCNTQTKKKIEILFFFKLTPMKKRQEPTFRFFLLRHGRKK
jgi:hypothetical protein